MKKLETSFFDLQQLPEIAQTILKFSEGRKVFAFYAPMGAGKTTLIKELCRQLGSKDNLSSPSYSIVNEYAAAERGNRIYHMDLYRIKTLDEALAAGVEEYINSDCYCFIEWPEVIETVLPPNLLKITMDMDGNIRNVTIFMN